MSEALLDAIRNIKGKGLTQEEVDRINATLPSPALATAVVDPNDLVLI